MPSTRKYYRWLYLALGAAALAAVTGAIATLAVARSTCINIGFVGDFTGASASISAMARDGARLAVEDCNQAGGIRGSPINLMVGDDASIDARSAELVDLYARSDCWAVIGPTTSQTVPAALHASSGRFAIITPTVDDDNPGWATELFTIGPSNVHTLEFAARYLYVQRHLRHPLVILDQSAKQFGAGLGTFTSWMNGPGSDIPKIIEMGVPPRCLADVAREAANASADSVVIIAASAQAAMLIQHLRLAGCQLPVVVPQCLATEDLLLYGGRALEGTTVFTTVDVERLGNAYRGFVERFTRRFGYQPGPAAARGFEAAHIALLCIVQASSPAEVRGVLASRRSFDGLRGRITFNESGDTTRELVAVQVRDGSLRAME